MDMTAMPDPLHDTNSTRRTPLTHNAALFFLANMLELATTYM